MTSERDISISKIPQARPRRAPRPVPSDEARTARRVLIGLPVSLLLLAIGLRLLITSEPVRREFASYVARELADRTQAAVQLGGVTFGAFFEPCFQDLEIYRIHGSLKLRSVAKEACVDRWMSAVGSGFRAIRIKLSDPSIEFRGETSKNADAAFVNVVPSDRGGSVAARPALRELEVIFDGLRLKWDTMPFPERFAFGNFGPIDGKVTVQLRGDQSAAILSVREPRTGARVEGRVHPTGAGWDLSAGVEGDLVPIFESFLVASEIDIRKLPTTGRIGMIYDRNKNKLTLDLNMTQHNVDLASDVVSSQRIQNFRAKENLRIDVDFERGTLDAKEGVVEVNGVPIVFSLSVRPGTKSPHFLASVNLRTTSLVRLLRSIPDAEETELIDKISPSVLFAMDFDLEGELSEPESWQTRFEHRVVGVGPNGEGSGLRYLKRPFEYRPLTKEGRRSTPLLVGVGTPNWVPFKSIPYPLRRAIQVSEDSTFFTHDGIEMEAIRAAVQESMSKSERPRGGSTLTQQLIKNLYLSRDRTALRKIQEAVLTYLIESTLSK